MLILGTKVYSCKCTSLFAFCVTEYSCIWVKNNFGNASFVYRHTYLHPTNLTADLIATLVAARCRLLFVTIDHVGTIPYTCRNLRIHIPFQRPSHPQKRKRIKSHHVFRSPHSRRAHRITSTHRLLHIRHRRLGYAKRPLGPPSGQ